MATEVKFVTVPSKTLAASINAAAMTIQLSDILGWDGNALAAANFGDVLWCVLRDSSNSFMELMKLDPTTIAAGSITVLKRGLDFSGADTEVTVNKLTWIKNDTIVELGSNPPQLLNQTVRVSGTQTIIDLKTFMTLPKCTAVPTATDDLVNKAYADSLAFGTTHVDQIIITAVAGETLVAGNAVYYKIADGRWWKARSNVVGTSDDLQLGIAQGSAVAGGAINILTSGLDKNQTGLTNGAIYYLSDTAGAIGNSAGTISVVIGQAYGTTNLLVNPRYNQVPTTLQKSGLASTTALSGTNLVVSQQDLQKGTVIYGASVVGTDAYAFTATPAISAYSAGMIFRVLLDVGNTGPATLAIGTGGVKAIVKNGNTALVTGDLLAGQMIEVAYQAANDNFQLVSPIASIPIYTNGVDISRAYNAANGSIVIAHGLGVIPKKVRVTASVNIAGTNNVANWGRSVGVYNGTTVSCLYEYNLSTTSGSNVFTNATDMLHIEDGTNKQVCTISVDATNITLTCTKTGTPATSDALKILWEANS